MHDPLRMAAESKAAVMAALLGTASWVLKGVAAAATGSAAMLADTFHPIDDRPLRHGIVTKPWRPVGDSRRPGADGSRLSGSRSQYPERR